MEQQLRILCACHVRVPETGRQSYDSGFSVCNLRQASNRGALSQSTQSVCNLSACDEAEPKKTCSPGKWRESALRPWKLDKQGPEPSCWGGTDPLRRPTVVFCLFLFWSGYDLIIILSLFWLAGFLSHSSSSLISISSLWNYAGVTLPESSQHQHDVRQVDINPSTP